MADTEHKMRVLSGSSAPGSAARRQNEHVVTGFLSGFSDNRSHGDFNPHRLLVALAISIYLSFSLAYLHLPGLDYDETVFVNAALGDPEGTGTWIAWKIEVFGRSLLLMVMNYIGALKAWLFEVPPSIAVGSSIGKKLKPLILRRFAPVETKAAEDFNKQPDGSSAFWAETENATQSTVLALNGTALESTVRADGKLVTAAVPRHLYAKPGEYSLYLLDRNTSQRSNDLRFIVKP